MSSLRSVETGFNQHRNHHYHLHTKQVRRTTLADANERRDPILFEELTRALMARAGNAIRKERQELLYLIDSTTIGLHGRGNEWTQASACAGPRRAGRCGRKARRV